MAANRFNFRVWLEEHQTMTRTYHVEDVPTADCDTNYILMQSTGLGDANGVEIFEGDVVYVAGIGNMVVEYDQSVAGMRFKDDDQDLDYQEVIEDLERVIGNIHQNPELLEAS